MSDSSKSAAMAERPATPVRVTPARVPALMRKCACSGSAASCDKCGEEDSKKKIQRKASTSAPIPSSAPAVDHVVSGAGRPLDASTRGFMESRFGHDFGDVRVHTGSEAAESARAVGAHAYTVGNDIVFDHGRYDPHSESGRHLLAHELTHTVQQRGMQRSANPSLGTTTPGDAYEAEADAIASRIVSGAHAGPFVPHATAHAPVIARSSVTGNQKPESATNPKAAKLAQIGFVEVDLPDADKSKTRRFDSLKGFPVPKSKGENALKLWQAKAASQGNALEAVIDPNDEAKPRIAKAQQRPPTEVLRAIWLEKVQWSEADADANWSIAADDASVSFHPPKAGGAVCDFDHIVELQIGGNNVPENIQPLDASPNRSSGAVVKNYLVGEAKKIRKIYEGLDNVILHYNGAEVGEGEEPDACYKVEVAATTGGSKFKLTAPVGDPFPVTAGGSNATIRIPKKSPNKIPLGSSELLANRAAATLIPGMVLDELHRKENQVSAKFDTAKGSKTKLPVDVDPQAHVTLNIVKAGEKNELKIDPAKKQKIGFTFPFLSKGTITKLELKDSGLSAEGTLEPSIPLLKGITIGISVSPERVALLAPIPKETLKEKLKSLPGFKITDAELALLLYPEFVPSGKIAFLIGSEKNKLIEGAVTLSAPSGEFTAKGDITANLPGFDVAKGDVLYTRKSGWSGVVKLATSKFPGAKNISVELAFTDAGYTVSGGLTIPLPPVLGKDLDLSVKQEPGKKPVYKGKVDVNIPKLDPVKLTFTYDGDDLTATGDTGFKLLGVTGKVAVRYHNGSITGKGKLDLKKGRATGSIDVEMLRNGKFKGEGQLSYQITESLVATAGAKLDENEKLTIMGALEFTKPIELFKPSGGSYKFFSIGIKIPVPGASIGPVGIQARIDASLSAGYQIGPGELRKVKVEATFNPLEENVDPKLKMSGQLYIGASASVFGEISGSIALDLLVAEVAGGISVIPSATLKGEFTADALAEYEKQHYAIKADLAVNLALTFALALTAWVKAKAGISIFSVETRKDWTLAKFTYDPGLKLGVKAPIRYSSREPFKLPSADEIVFTKPNIDVQGMLKSIFGGARSEEKKL